MKSLNRSESSNCEVGVTIPPRWEMRRWLRITATGTEKRDDILVVGYEV